MPDYEYKCKNCGEKFEIRRSLQEQEKGSKCPRCGAHDTYRVFSVFGSRSSASKYAPSSSRSSFG